MNELGSYTVSIIDDGMGVTFTAKPSPLGIIIFLIFTFFPPYTLLLFLTFHAVLRTSAVMSKLEPVINGVLISIQNGAHAFVDRVTDFIDDFSKDKDDLEPDVPEEYSDEGMEYEEEADSMDMNVPEEELVIQLHPIDTENDEGDEGVEGDDEDDGKDVGYSQDLDSNEMQMPSLDSVD